MGSWKYKSDKPPERDGVETFGSHEKGTFCEAGTFKFSGGEDVKHGMVCHVVEY